MSKKARKLPGPRTTEKANAASLSLTGELGIRQAERLRQDLLEAIAAGKSLRLCVGAKTVVDTSIVQVLLASIRSATRRDLTIEIDGMAESPLPRVLTSLGFASPDDSRSVEPTDMLKRAALTEEDA